MFKVLNAYEFERHAGCKTKHPNNHIYFENGKTIYQIVQELRSTPESLLFDAIQTVTGSPINQKSFRIWKGNINSTIKTTMKFTVSFSVIIGNSLISPPCVSASTIFYLFLCPLMQNHFKQLHGSLSVSMERRN